MLFPWLLWCGGLCFLGLRPGGCFQAFRSGGGYAFCPRRTPRVAPPSGRVVGPGSVLGVVRRLRCGGRRWWRVLRALRCALAGVWGLVPLGRAAKGPAHPRRRGAGCARAGARVASAFSGGRGRWGGGRLLGAGQGGKRHAARQGHLECPLHTPRRGRLGNFRQVNAPAAFPGGKGQKKKTADMALVGVLWWGGHCAGTRQPVLPTSSCRFKPSRSKSHSPCSRFTQRYPQAAHHPGPSVRLRGTTPSPPNS